MVAQAFTAYDCAHNNITATIIDLTEPDHCATLDPGSYSDTNVTVSVISTANKLTIHAVQCRVLLTQKAVYCGSGHATYGTRFLEIEKPIHISPSHCTDQDGPIIADGQPYPANTLDHGDKYSTSYPRGNLDHDHYCETESFTYNGVSFSSHYVEQVARTTRASITGTYNAASGTVTFGNVAVPFAQGYLQDVTMGTITWNTTNVQCKSTTDIIYKGNATKHSPTDTTTGGITIITIGNSNTKQYGAFTLKQPIPLCGKACFATQLEDFTICFTDTPETHFGTDPLPTLDFHNTERLAGIHTFQVNHALTTRSNFQAINKALCEVDAKTIANKRQHILATDSSAAVMDLYGPGYQVTRAGAVAYVAKCVPIEVNIYEEADNCTQELPVILPAEYKDRIRYMDPVTKIVTNYPTYTVCSEIIRPMIRIGSTWYEYGPIRNSSNTFRPATITPTVITSTVLKLKLFHFEIILAASIYTEQDKVEYNLYITQISARAPITSSMVNSKLDYADNPQAALTFDDTSFKSLKSAFLFLVNPIAYILGDVGQYYMWFMSFLLFLVMLKVAAEGFYHILLQYSTDGCGTWCLLAWLRTCWNVAKAPVALNDAAVERLVDDHPTQDHIQIEMTDMALPSRDIEQERRDFDPREFASHRPPSYTTATAPPLTNLVRYPSLTSLTSARALQAAVDPMRAAVTTAATTLRRLRSASRETLRRRANSDTASRAWSATRDLATRARSASASTARSLSRAASRAASERSFRNSTGSLNAIRRSFRQGSTRALTQLNGSLRSLAAASDQTINTSRRAARHALHHIEDDARSTFSKASSAASRASRKARKVAFAAARRVRTSSTLAYRLIQHPQDANVLTLAPDDARAPLLDAEPPRRPPRRSRRDRHEDTRH